MVAVFFNVFTDMELPGRIIAAFLGVVITAAITQLLLQGQTDKEETLRRDAKVFEEKLRIYQKFRFLFVLIIEHKEMRLCYAKSAKGVLYEERGYGRNMGLKNNRTS